MLGIVRGLTHLIIFDTRFFDMKTTLTILAALVFGLAAKADFISYTNSLSASPTDWTQNIGLRKFNPALGTLDSIQVTIQSGMTTVLQVTNYSHSASEGTAITQLKLNLSTGSYSLFDATHPALTLLSPDFDYTLSGSSATSSGSLYSFGSVTGKLLTDSPTLSAFAGSGSVSISVSTSTLTYLANDGGNTASSQTTSASLGAIVTYGFTSATFPPAPTPEPSTLALLGAGLAGLTGWAGRRSVRK